MNTIRREWLLFRKRYVIWGILACVVLLSYLGFCGYVPFWIWRKYRLLMEMNRDILTEQRPLAETLLWWSALCRMGLNRFNLMIPVALAGCSVGIDAYRRRFAGIQICGRSAWRSSYLVTFLSNYLVTVVIVLISILMQILRTRPQFQKASGAADLVVLQKPLLYLLVSFFCYTAVAHWVCFIFGQRSIWRAFLAAFLACQGIFLAEEWIARMLFPYGDGFLELDQADRLDEQDGKGCHELQRSLNRLTEAGCIVILYAKNMEKVQRLAGISC